jgi:hypothetical protein
MPSRLKASQFKAQGGMLLSMQLDLGEGFDVRLAAGAGLKKVTSRENNLS